MKLCIVDDGTSVYFEIIADDLDDANQIVGVCSAKLVEGNRARIIGPQPRIQPRGNGPTVQMKIYIGPSENIGNQA